ncbi:MAG: response regulator transcription factor [Nitrospirota bacterium]|nr:response regulator transcription factor [Nitrospirota bacterium]
MNTLSLVLADDHYVVRQGLRSLLEKDPFCEVIGEAGDGVETLRKVTALRPEMLILDLMMPLMNGIEVLKRIKRASLPTQVVVLSMYNTAAYAAEALKQGALGYVLKDALGPDLLNALREVRAGRRYLSPPLSESTVEFYLEKTASTGIDPGETLTAREREILRLVGEGLKSKEIAARLLISLRTVETHRSNIMRKLAITSQAGLVRCALERDLSPLT